MLPDSRYPASMYNGVDTLSNPGKPMQHYPRAPKRKVTQVGDEHIETIDSKTVRRVIIRPPITSFRPVSRFSIPSLQAALVQVAKRR